MDKGAYRGMEKVVNNATRRAVSTTLTGVETAFKAAEGEAVSDSLCEEIKRLIKNGVNRMSETIKLGFVEKQIDKS